MRENGTVGKEAQQKDKPKQLQGSGFKPKGNFVKKRAPFKGSHSSNTMRHVIDMAWNYRP
jgi:hypothetical protein